MVISIYPAPSVADAGTDQQLGCDAFSASLIGNTTGVGTGTWTTSGAATIDDIHNPASGVSGLANGNNTFTWTITSPGCNTTSDEVTITTSLSATANAGSNQSVCENSSVSLSGSIGGSAISSTWTTSGDGSFDDAASLNTVYTPGSSDISADSVTLTLITNDPAGTCAAATSSIVINIYHIVAANAGMDQTLDCDAFAALLEGSNPSPGQGTWTSSGAYTYDDIHDPNTIVFDLVSGPNTLTWTVVNGSCTSSDEVIITIPTSPVVDAGPNQTVCSNSTVSLMGSISGTVSTGTWSTSGDGSFNDVHALNAIYTPGPADINSSNVTLLLTSDPSSGCGSASDDIVISINPVATVDAGADQSFCSHGARLSGSIGGAATSAIWTSNGDGTFNDASSLTAIYTPGTSDVTAGTVTLTLTTNNPDGPCEEVSDQVVLTLYVPIIPVINPSGTVSLCDGDSTTLSTTSGGTLSWSTGALTSSIIAIESGSYTVTTTDGNGCSSISAATEVEWTAVPVAIITGDNAYCSGNSSILSAESSEPGGGTISSYQWFKDGSILTGENNPTYTATTPGVYTVTVTNSNGCASVVCQ